MRERGTSAVDRLTAGDLMQWQADVGPVPRNIGALLTLSAPRPAAAELRGLVADRLGTIPRLARRPVRPPRGCGGWIWVDDDREPQRHATVERVASADPHSVLATAVACTARRLPADRSPWAAHVVTGPGDEAVALVVVLHHVLADGLAGLAMLAALVDGAPLQPLPPQPPIPGRGELVRDAWRRRGAALRAMPAALRAMPGAWRELGRGATGTAPRTSLNTPTGARREAAVATVDLADVRRTARHHDGSVNDVLLVAAAEAVREVLAARGEHLDPVVVSVPVALRDPGVRAAVGNAVGATAIAVPTSGPLPARVEAVAQVRRARLAEARGRSFPLVLSAFRLLHLVGAVDRYANHQRMANTFVTSLVGPTGAVVVGGSRVSAVLPLVLNQGNATVSFEAISYDGRLDVVVTTDPQRGSSAAAVADVLAVSLRRLLADG